MALKWDFWNKELVDDIESLRQEQHAVSTLLDSPGWEWLVSKMVERSNELIHEWKVGAHSLEKHERFAAQISLIGEVLDLPRESLDSLNSRLKTVVTENDNPEDAIDQDQMSPVPNEPDYPAETD